MYMPVPVTYMTGSKNTFGVAPKTIFPVATGWCEWGLLASSLVSLPWEDIKIRSHVGWQENGPFLIHQVTLTARFNRKKNLVLFRTSKLVGHLFICLKRSILINAFCFPGEPFVFFEYIRNDFFNHSILSFYFTITIASRIWYCCPNRITQRF